MSWKRRTVIATAAAALLTGGGIIALANAAPESASPGTATVTPTNAPATGSVAGSADTAELERSLDGLLSQVDGLEQSLVTTGPTPSSSPSPSATPFDDHGGDRPDGVSDDDSSHDDDDDDDRGGHSDDDDSDDDGSDDRGGSTDD